MQACPAPPALALAPAPAPAPAAPAPAPAPPTAEPSKVHAHDLKQVRLRPATGVRDASAPQLFGFAETAEQLREYQDCVLDINIESWLPLIEEFTFATEFVPLSPGSGQLFVDSYLAYEAHLKTAVAEGRAAGQFAPSLELTERTARLASTLQAAVERVRATDGAPVFIKASSRSAKDAPTSNQRLGEVYAGLLEAESPDQSDNIKLRCMLTAGLEMLKAYSASDALSLFLCSERIYQDMLLALERPERWNESFAVRRWVDIDVGMEFRGFVKGGNLTALSQYNHLCFFPELVERQVEIEGKVRSFFDESIQERLAPMFQDYVIDFALTEGGSIYVIELNPFMESTCGCLFSWQKESNILFGAAEFEFRIVTAVRNGAKALVANDWRQLLEQGGEAWQVSSGAAGLRG